MSEEISCPDCETKLRIEIDNLPTSLIETECSGCSAIVRSYRTTEGGFSIKTRPKYVERTLSHGIKKLTPELIDSVRQKLPVQPWPQGTHKKIAEDLGISNQLVSLAIDHLIVGGDAEPQVDGKVVARRETTEPLSSIPKGTPNGEDNTSNDPVPRD